MARLDNMGSGYLDKRSVRLDAFQRASKCERDNTEYVNGLTA